MVAKYERHPLEAMAQAALDPVARAQAAMEKDKARYPEAEIILRHLHGYRCESGREFEHDRHLLAAKLQALAESERFAGFADATRDAEPAKPLCDSCAARLEQAQREGYLGITLCGECTA